MILTCLLATVVPQMALMASMMEKAAKSIGAQPLMGLSEERRLTAMIGRGHEGVRSHRSPKRRIRQRHSLQMQCQLPLPQRLLSFGLMERTPLRRSSNSSSGRTIL